MFVVFMSGCEARQNVCECVRAERTARGTGVRDRNLQQWPPTHPHPPICMRHHAWLTCCSLLKASRSSSYRQSGWVGLGACSV